jgi:NAD(P)-dependent dehydrogenase (short-subunit alcohol dehydrogenase family)
MNRATDRRFPGFLGMPEQSLKGCRVVVTGGAGGVGRETAARMIERGARVVSADIASATRHAKGSLICSATCRGPTNSTACSASSTASSEVSTCSSPAPACPPTR